MEKCEQTRLLVVDDDALIRDILGMVLEEKGYLISKAENGADAIHKHTATPVDLIVSDMNMPEVDGLELIKRVRAGGDNVPIIILTGNSEISTAINAMNSGANDYLLKDENIQETVSISVKKVLERKRLEEQNRQLMADLARKNELLEKDKNLAQKVQKNILPRDLNFSAFDVGTFYEASDKIGGDFFDAWESQGKIHLVIGDVSGHSTSSALIMAVCKGVIRSLGQMSSDPQEIVRSANAMLCEVLGDSGMFISLVYCIVDRVAEELQVLSAGHNPIFLFGNNGLVEVDSMGPVIGWDPEDSWDMQRFPFGRGCGIFMYTDGVSEAKDLSGEEFGEGRLKAMVSNHFGSSEMIERVFTAAKEFCAGNFPDDLTMIALQREG